MTSERKILANRRNSLRSTGPKTKEGKIRSARNAVTHGLSSRTRPHTREAERLARSIAGSDASPDRLAQAEATAMAHFDMIMAREAIASMPDEVLKPDGSVASPQERKGQMHRSRLLRRYLRKASAERRKALRAFESTE